ASSATMLTAGAWLLYRRYGSAGESGSSPAPAYRTVLALSLAALLFTIVYNRAWHLGARRLRRPALVLAIAAGLAAILGLAARAPGRGSDRARARPGPPVRAPAGARGRAHVPRPLLSRRARPADRGAQEADRAARGRARAPARGRGPRFRGACTRRPGGGSAG